MILRSYRWLILVLFVCGTRGQDTEEEDEGTAHFSDPKGRLSWVIDDTSLPWVGSYNFLGSSISHSTVLLSVVDSSTGIKLGECNTKSFPHLETFTAIPPIMQNDIWHKVVFSLQADSLQCNVSESEFHMKPFPPTHHPRSFSVRILAEKGPSCIRGLIVQNEQPIGCPPLLKRNNFSSHNFECGCRNSITNKWNNAQVDLGNVEAKSAEVKPTSPVEFPIFHLTTDEVEEEHVTNRQVFPTTPSIQASSLVSTLKIHTLPPATISPPTFIVTSHPCSSYSCLNNGTCIVDVHTQPHCICRDGYTGEHCETDLCSTFACQNGGRCQIVNGQPICQCPAGTTGTKCEQAVCEKPCQNGGQCIFMGGKHICQCLNGFIGGNCNVRDVCQNASICSVFGSEARCQLESESYASSPNETTDAEYDCHCLDDKHEWAKCLDLALARQAARLTTLPTTTTTIATTSTTSTPTSTSRPAILLVPSSTVSPANEVFSKEVIKNELEREIEKGEQRGKFVASSSRKHPSNKTISIENRPDPEDYSTEKGSPEFPLTNIPTESEELSTPEFSATVSTPTTETPTFSRLPDLSPIFTKTTEESTTTTSDYQEEEENNGFETFTQIVPEVEEHRTSKFGVPVYSTFKPNTPSPWPTSSKSIEIGAGGQLIHSKELSGNEIVDITESTPMEKIPEEVIIEASTNPNFVVNRGSVDLGENIKTNQQPARNRENTGATTLTWIIAISAFVALLLLTSGSGLFVLRYVKRSRRLHGKYNPAREENMVASTYAMPMTSVSKEERLI